MSYKEGTRMEWLDDRIDEIVELYTEEGLSLRAIGDEFGVSAETIRRRLNEQGVSTSLGGPEYVPIEEKIIDIADRHAEQGDSLRTIASDLGTSVAHIRRYLNETSVNTRTDSRKTVDIVFSPSQVSVVTGELLGDGCLFRQSDGATFFQLSNTVKSHTTNVLSKLPDGLFPESAPTSHTRDDGFGPEYTTWALSSRLHPFFDDLYDDWYEQHEDGRRKVVPEDFDLNRTALMHWFWGDGCTSIRDHGAPRVSFATHGFSKASVEHLQRELDRLGYENYTAHQHDVASGSGLSIRLRDPSARTFLEDMRPRNTIPEYDYKFPVPDV